METVAPLQFDWTLIAIAAPFAAALAARLIMPLASGIYAAFATLLLALVPATGFVFFGVLLPPLSNGLVIFGAIGWLKPFGIEFTYAIDGLSVLFVLLVNFVGTVALIDAAIAPGGADMRGRDLSSLLLLVASMQGLVLADSFLALIVFAAIAALAAASTAPPSAAAGQAGWRRGGSVLAPSAIVAAAALILLFAARMLARESAGFDDGTITSMTGAINAAWQLRESELYAPLVAAMLAGIFVFALQGPAIVRPASHSSVPAQIPALFYGAVVLTPVYLLLRVHPFLGDTPAWSLAVPLAGALILIAGAAMALRRQASMHAVAWAAIASSGSMIMVIGTSLNPSVYAAAAMVAAHGLSVTALMLTAGRLPAYSAAGPSGRFGTVIALLAGLALCGAPLTIGYVAKGALYDGLWDAAFPDLLGEPSVYAGLLQAYTLAVLGVFVAGNGLILAALFKFVFAPAGGPLDEPAVAPAARWLAPLVLVAAGSAAALAAGWVSRMLIDPARYGANLVPYRISPPELAGPALGLTILSFAMAAFVFAVNARWRRFAGVPSPID